MARPSRPKGRGRFQGRHLLLLSLLLPSRAQCNSVAGLGPPGDFAISNELFPQPSGAWEFENSAAEYGVSSRSWQSSHQYLFDPGSAEGSQSHGKAQPEPLQAGVWLPSFASAAGDGGLALSVDEVTGGHGSLQDSEPFTDAGLFNIFAN